MDCLPISSAAPKVDELLLGEAQDTSEPQLGCPRELHKTGCLTSLVLIGDFEQSICPFRGGGREWCRR